MSRSDSNREEKVSIIVPQAESIPTAPRIPNSEQIRRGGSDNSPGGRWASIKRIAALVLVIGLISQAFGSWHLEKLQRYAELQEAEAVTMELKVKVAKQAARAVEAERLALMSGDFMRNALGSVVDALRIISKFSRRTERPGQEELMAILLSVPKEERAQFDQDLKQFEQALERVNRNMAPATRLFFEWEDGVNRLRDQRRRESAQDQRRQGK